MPESELPTFIPIPPAIAVNVRSAYLHVPFCSHKCGYCDFASVAGQDDRMTDYLDALEAEIAGHLTQAATVDTIFIGGGTPTYLSAALLQRLMEIVHRWFHLAPDGEFSVESNPNTLTAEKVTILADAGVNRMSLGAQSFHRHLLTVLERDHDPDSVRRAIDRIRQRIDNFSVDLIFGVPGQSLDEWKSDLEAVIALETNHCSTYGLTYEKGTRLWRQRKLGMVQPVDEELERSMFEYALDRLADRGWEHYEISNFARACRVCRHNLTYWANDDCFGFGTGAAAYVDGTRRLNTRELDSYINRCVNGKSPASQSETLDPEERARETAMVNLRRDSGLVRRDFLAKTGFDIDALAGKQIHRFVELGFLDDNGESIRFTREGLFIADAILREIV